MKLFFQFFNLRLSDIRIKGLLHFTFKLIFSFPQKNLSLTFYDLVHKFGFLFSNFINVDFQFDSFPLHFFKLLNKLAFKVNVFILKFALFVTVNSNVIVKFVHFLLKAFEIDLNFFDFLFKRSVIIIEPWLFLFHDSFFVFQIHYCINELLELIVFMNENSLLFDPLAIQFIACFFQFFSFPNHIDEFIFKRIFRVIIGFRHKLIMQLIKPSDFMLLLFINVMSLPDLNLIGNNEIFLFILLSKGFILFLLKELDLWFCVQLINFNSCDFVQKSFKLHFFLLNFDGDSVCLL